LQPQKLTVSAALALLGLPDDADRDAITSAYRRLARTTHPDRSGAADAAARFDNLTAAYRRALDPGPTTSATAPTAPPTAATAPTAPPTAATASAAPRVVTRTPHRRGPAFVVSIGVRGPVGPIIIVGPARVDPTSTRQSRRDR
jgi:hypothetical protein